MLAIFVVVTLAAGGVVLWRAATDADPSGVPPADEYIIYFAEDMPLYEQEAILHRYPFVTAARPGKLPGVMVARLQGNAAANARHLREDPRILQILKSTSGMVCH